MEAFPFCKYFFRKKSKIFPYFSEKTATGNTDGIHCGFLGEGDFDCGSNQRSASPKLTSLVTFLFSTRK